MAKKIIQAELSGVFNWVLEGLKRLLSQKKFTCSEVVNKQLLEYRKQSDSVLMFLEDEGFEISLDTYIEFKELFKQYGIYCIESNYRACNKNTFSKRLRNAGVETERKSTGIVIYIKKICF